MAARKRLFIVASISGVLLFGIALLIPYSRFYIHLGYLKARALLGIRNVDLNPARERWKAALGPDVQLPFTDARIGISKSARKLDLYSGDKLIKSYKIALGQHPAGAKTVSGDGRTPEGEYHICTRIESVFQLFLGLNYPNTKDAYCGFKNSVVNSADRDAIAEAESKKRKPDWNGPLGGAIGIHGGGTEIDWTAGCIAVEKGDVEEIFVATDMWTPVSIRE